MIPGRSPIQFLVRVKNTVGRIIISPPMHSNGQPKTLMIVNPLPDGKCVRTLWLSLNFSLAVLIITTHGESYESYESYESQLQGMSKRKLAKFLAHLRKAAVHRGSFKIELFPTAELVSQLLGMGLSENLQLCFQPVDVERHRHPRFPHYTCSVVFQLFLRLWWLLLFLLLLNLSLMHRGGISGHKRLIDVRQECLEAPL